MRAGSLNELIYKQGQAGVTKASVTLVFDNANPAMSPHGYDQYPQLTVTRQVCYRPLAPVGWAANRNSLRCVVSQVVIGGRNKYMINGTIAQQSRVQNLFHSVQLNVNNPHFLVPLCRSSTRCHPRCPELCSRPVAWLRRSCKVGSRRCST